MAVLVTAIPGLTAAPKTWMAGTSSRMTVIPAIQHFC